MIHSIAVIATFKGTDNSLGYIAKKEYVLMFKTARIKKINYIVIAPADGSASVCLYESLRVFLRNWDVIS